MKTCSKVTVGGTCLNQMFKGVIGNGKGIRFWLDPWACDEPLKDVFPSLFKLAKDKRCLVVDGLVEGGSRFRGIGDTTNGQMGDEGLGDLTNLERMLERTELSDNGDKWLWLGRDQKEFSVKAVKAYLNSDRDYSDRHVVSWSRWVPNKCNIFMWRVSLDRIQTATALRRRNCNIASILCGLCDEEEEDVDHLFCHCGGFPGLASNMQVV